MTLIKRNKSLDLKPTFWRRVRAFFVTTMLVAFAGFELGYLLSKGMHDAFFAIPKAALATFLGSMVGCWIPVGFYYEGHRYRWIYIVLFWILLLGLAMVIGYSVAGSL